MSLVQHIANRWNGFAAEHCSLLCWNAQVGRVAVWNRAGGNEQLYSGHDLNENSLVVDVGGFRGDWSAEISARYAPHIHILEPVPEFVQRLRDRFAGNPKIKIHPFGLGAVNESVSLHVQGDGSSVHRAGGDAVVAKVVCASDFIRSLPTDDISLLKINIEGSEYDLLDDVLDSGLMECVRTLLVQFHDFVPAAGKRMQALHAQLSQTHRPQFQYEFVWESWQRNTVRQRDIPRNGAARLSRPAERTVQASGGR
jgi:FkbM family methyltransferase